MESTFVMHMQVGCGIDAEYAWTWLDTGVQVPVCRECVGHRLGLMIAPSLVSDPGPFTVEYLSDLL